MRILIAGAGIGGLTAALCLQQAGHEVQIFEQSSEFREIGAGIQCGANALRVMDHLGLLQRLQETAVAPERVEFCDHLSGAVLYTAPLGQEYKQEYGAPYLHIHRPDLIAVLVDAFKQRNSGSDTALHMSAQCSHFAEEPAKVVLHLQDGRHFEGDVLIAADGIKSALRQQILGETKPHYTSNVAWRGVVPVENLPDNFMPKITANFVGPNKHMVIYYLRNQRLVNFVGVVESEHSDETSWVNRAPWQELADDFAGWHPTVQAVIDAVDKEQCFRWALYDHPAYRNWSTARVSLLGDAAHATLPFMASGAAMAIEDGRVLQRALDQTDKVEQGLALYQSNRFARTAEIQRSSRHFAKLYHINNRLAQKLAFKALKSIGRRKERFLPDYDANTVELS